MFPDWVQWSAIRPIERSKREKSGDSWPGPQLTTPATRILPASRDMARPCWPSERWSRAKTKETMTTFGPHCRIECVLGAELLCRLLLARCGAVGTRLSSHIILVFVSQLFPHDLLKRAALSAASLAMNSES